MKWIQTKGTGYTQEFELESDRTTTITLIGDIEKVKRKLKNIFGPNIKIVTFEDME